MTNQTTSIDDLEIVDIVNDLFEFLKQSKRRTLGPAQLKMMLGRKLSEVKSSLNKFVVSTSLNPETKAKTLLDLLYHLGNCLNLIPSSGVLLESYKDLGTIINATLLNLTLFYGKQSLWRYQASTNLIIHILSEVGDLEELPTKPKPDDPQYFNITRLTLNQLNTTALVYKEIIRTLYTLPEENFVQWTNQGFKQLSLLYNYTRALLEDIEKLVSVTEVDNVYKRSFHYHQIVSEGFFFALDMLGLLGEGWRSDIDSFNLIDSYTINEVRSFSHQLAMELKATVTLLQRLYKEGHINVNTPPLESAEVKALERLQATYQAYDQLLLLLSRFGPNLSEQNLLLPSVEEALANSNPIMTYFEHNYPGGKTNPFYVRIVVFYQALACLGQILKNELNAKVIELDQFSEVRSTIGTDSYPELTYYLLLFQTWVLTNRGTPDQLVSVQEELPMLLEPLKTQPRDYLSVVELYILVSLNTQGISEEELSKLEQEVEEVVFTEGGQTHLKPAWDSLIKALKSISLNQRPKMLMECPKTKPLDYLTWVIPHFRLQVETEELIVPFIPFNTLECKILKDPCKPEF